MMDAGNARSRPVGGYNAPQTFYEMEVLALQNDLAAMNHDMQDALSKAQAEGEASYQAQKSVHDGQLATFRNRYIMDADRFKAEEEAAIAHEQALRRELQALHSQELTSLRQRMPRPVRPTVPHPEARPHGRDISQVYTAKVHPKTLPVAQAVLVWLRDAGLQAQHARGESFLDEMLKLAVPRQIKNMTQARRLALHAELNAVPASLWDAAQGTVARVLDAREIDAVVTEQDTWGQRAWSSLMQHIMDFTSRKRGRLP